MIDNNNNNKLKTLNLKYHGNSCHIQNYSGVPFSFQIAQRICKLINLKNVKWLRKRGEPTENWWHVF